MIPLQKCKLDKGLRVQKEKVSNEGKNTHGYIGTDRKYKF